MKTCKKDGFVFRKVVIPAALGDDVTGQDRPANGAYTNSYVEYEANGAQYIYDSYGIYTKFKGEGDGDTKDFNQLDNRPKYAGEVMTGDTDIPEVVDAILYDATGANTDGAMTQAAATQMIFPSGSEVAKDKIAIGKISNASAIGQSTIQISSSTSNASPITSIGAVSMTSGSLGVAGNYGVEIGNRTTTGEFSVAVGSLATALDNNVAVGSSVNAFGTQSVALGYSAKTGITDQSGKNYSVALGAHSLSGRDSEISIGDGTNNANYGTRYVANVKDPALAQDAATKNYVDTLISALEARVAALEGNS